MENLPIEIINLILHCPQFKKLNELLKLRLISPRWRHAVEDFCSRKKSLHLKDNRVKSWETRVEKYCGITTSQRFFGAVNVECCLQIEIKYPTSLNRHLTGLILKLFPNIDLLIFGAQLDHQSTATNLIYLMSYWSNISTLSIEKSVDRQYQIPMASAINRLKKLIRLDIPSHFETSLLLQTLGRIQHLSMKKLHFFYPDLSVLVGRIGPNCSRLWYENWDLSTTPEELYKLKKVNDSLYLTHFGYFSQFGDPAPIINAHFSSLHTLYLCKFYRWTEMGHVSTLSELRVLQTRVRSFCDISVDMSRPMVNVHTFEFSSILEHGDQLVAVDLKTFCTGLAWLLPNVKHLILVFHELALVEMFQENLSMFRNLCTHKVKHWSQIE